MQVLSGFLAGRRNLCEHDIVSGVSFVFAGQLRSHIVKSSCMIGALFVSASRLVFNVQIYFDLL